MAVEAAIGDADKGTDGSAESLDTEGSMLLLSRLSSRSSYR